MYLKVNAVRPLTVPAGLQCAVDGDTVRPLTSLMVILMLASVPLLQIVLGGLRLVLSGATVRRLKDQEEEDKPTSDPPIVVGELEKRQVRGHKHRERKLERQRLEKDRKEERVGDHRVELGVILQLGAVEVEEEVKEEVEEEEEDFLKAKDEVMEE